MHSHILIATDGSEASAAAVEYGIALAKAVGAKITGLIVSRPAGVTVDVASHGDPRANAAQNELTKVADYAASAGISCDVVHAEHDHPYQAIIDTANSRGCDLIVMGSHGRRGLSAVLLGSETAKVLTHSNIPVLVCRGPSSGLFPAYFAAS